MRLANTMEQWHAWVLLALGAMLSQVAEWMHLKVFRDYDWWQAYLGALCVVCVEYVCSVNANRALSFEFKQPVFLLQITWNVTQQVVVNLFIVWALGETYNRWHLAALLSLCCAFVCAFMSAL